MKRKLIAILAAAAGLAISTPAAAQGSCTTESLTEMAESWKAALRQGTMMTMQLGEWVDYDENFEKKPLGAFLDNPREIEWSMELLDLQSCQVLVEAVVASDLGRQVLATRFGSGFFGVGGFQNIVTGEGDWLFDAEGYANFASQEDWDVVPESKRVNRRQLQAVADAYLDRFNDPAVEVAWGEPCNRLEGGIYVGTGAAGAAGGCATGMPDEPGVLEAVERVYIVDEARQAVNVISKLGPDQLPDSHTFRMEDGMIRYVHAVTNCKGLENCGFPALGE